MGSPLTGAVFIFELTHELNVPLGLFIGSVAAFGDAVLVLRHSVLTEKLVRCGQHIARRYSVDVLEMVTNLDELLYDAVGNTRTTSLNYSALPAPSGASTRYASNLPNLRTARRLLFGTKSPGFGGALPPARSPRATSQSAVVNPPPCGPGAVCLVVGIV